MVQLLFQFNWCTEYTSFCQSLAFKKLYSVLHSFYMLLFHCFSTLMLTMCALEKMRPESLEING
jgi:hypothetical protein